MNAEDNKFLRVKNKSVLLNEIIEPVIVYLDKYFEAANLKATVTSGERTSECQLDIIRQYAIRYKVDEEYPDILDCSVLGKTIVDGVKYFAWQHAWSRLLNLGVIINPPLPAKCLFDYWRGSVNKKGTIIGYSPHYWGKAFDIGGGLDHDISNEIEVVQKALNDKVQGLKGYLAERKNNCVHVDCYPVPVKSSILIG